MSTLHDIEQTTFEFNTMTVANASALIILVDTKFIITFIILVSMPSKNAAVFENDKF